MDGCIGQLVWIEFCNKQHPSTKRSWSFQNSYTFNWRNHEYHYKGISNKAGGMLKQSIGPNGYLNTSFGLNTGKSKMDGD